MSYSNNFLFHLFKIKGRNLAVSILDMNLIAKFTQKYYLEFDAIYHSKTKQYIFFWFIKTLIRHIFAL